MPETVKRQPRKRGPKFKYPFGDWLTTLRSLKPGEGILLRRGKRKDYSCTSKTMSEQIYRWFQSEGVKVWVQQFDTFVVFGLKRR